MLYKDWEDMMNLSYAMMSGLNITQMIHKLIIWKVILKLVMISLDFKIVA